MDLVTDSRTCPQGVLESVTSITPAKRFTGREVIWGSWKSYGNIKYQFQRKLQTNGVTKLSQRCVTIITRIMRSTIYSMEKVFFTSTFLITDMAACFYEFVAPYSKRFAKTTCYPHVTHTGLTIKCPRIFMILA